MSGVVTRSRRIGRTIFSTSQDVASIAGHRLGNDGIEVFVK
jgi:hypothetical protein